MAELLLHLESAMGQANLHFLTSMLNSEGVATKPHD